MSVVELILLWGGATFALVAGVLFTSRDILGKPKKP
jgi:hypothetical protein